MKFGDLMSMCVRLVLRNRRRYKAVAAAIALGTIGFIVVRTMGDSVEKNLGKNLELLGEATVLAAVWSNHEENYHPGHYTMDDVQLLKRIPHVISVAPMVSTHRIFAYVGKVEWYPGLAGVDQNYWKTQTPTVKAGRLISASDVVGRRRVCVLGQDVVSYLFGDTNPVGKEIGFGSLTFTVIGTLGGIQHSDIKRTIFVPITTARSLFSGLYKISQIFIRVDNWNNVAEVRKAALKALRDAHPGYDHGIGIVYYPKRVQKVQTTVYIVKLFIYASVVVAFILGKVGLTNVMLAAVQDRTREIGLKKALGAQERYIMIQFLLESLLISVSSGFIGVCLGIATVQLLKGPLGVDISNYVISTSILVDITFTFAIGIWAGIYPSRMASRLDAVTAMRFE